MLKGKKLSVLTVATAAIVALSGCGSDTSQPVQQATAPAEKPVEQPAAEQPPADEQPKEEKNSPKMSKAEFDVIKSGMTYEEVTAIIGGPGELVSESGSPGEEFHTVMYQYEGEGQIGANANLMFQGGKLVNKAQFGLQ